jgi:hypothetical protein
MTKCGVTANGRDDQTPFAALAAQAQALLELATELERQVRAQASASALDLRRCTRDELLDGWQTGAAPVMEAAQTR